MSHFCLLFQPPTFSPHGPFLTAFLCVCQILPPSPFPKKHKSPSPLHNHSRPCRFRLYFCLFCCNFNYFNESFNCEIAKTQRATETACAKEHTKRGTELAKKGAVMSFCGLRKVGSCTATMTWAHPARWASMPGVISRERVSDVKRTIEGVLDWPFWYSGIAYN